VELLIPMALMLAVLYVLMIRPQRQRQAQQQSMIDAAGVGDDILTTGGIYGTITQADGDDLVVELGEGLSVHMTRRAIAAVLPPEDEEDEEEEEAAEEDEAELEDADEAEVADGVDAVRSEPSADASVEQRL
jgi:preprotein translocase subunit YajC